jgi:hypothetical protein
LPTASRSPRASVDFIGGSASESALDCLLQRPLIEHMASAAVGTANLVTALRTQVKTLGRATTRDTGLILCEPPADWPAEIHSPTESDADVDTKVRVHPRARVRARLPGEAAAGQAPQLVPLMTPSEMNVLAADSVRYDLSGWRWSAHGLDRCARESPPVRREARGLDAGIARPGIPEKTGVV